VAKARIAAYGLHCTSSAMLRAAAWRHCGCLLVSPLRAGVQSYGLGWRRAAASSAVETRPSRARDESGLIDNMLLQQQKQMFQQVKDLGALGQWREAFGLLEGDITSPDFSATARGAISAFGVGGQWQLALDVIGLWHQQKMPVPWPVHNQLIIAFARGGQRKMLVKLINELLSQGVLVDARSYTAAIAACNDIVQWEQAVALLQQMQSQGLPANVMCYANAINACGRSGEWEHALQLVSCLERPAATGMAHAHIAAINSCGVSGQWQQALQILNDMATAEVPMIDRVYGAAIIACAHSAEWQRAVQLLVDMQAAGCSITARNCSSAMTACGIAGQHERAVQLLDELLPTAGVSRTARMRMYSAAVTACAAANQWAQAVQLLQQFAQEQELCVTIDTSAAGDSRSSSQQRQIALKLLQQLHDQGFELLRIADYYSAIVATRASGELHKADAVYRHLLTSGLVQPWSTVEAGALDVASLYVTAVAEAAIRAVLHDMCRYCSSAAAAVEAAEYSSGEQYYVHDAATDLHIITRQQQQQQSSDTTDTTDDNGSSSDAENDADEYNSVLQLCVTDLLEQLDIEFTVSEVDGCVTVPSASLQQYVARTTGAATE
jgi:pentatricopeptide repeat protein